MRIPPSPPPKHTTVGTPSPISTSMSSYPVLPIVSTIASLASVIVAATHSNGKHKETPLPDYLQEELIPRSISARIRNFFAWTKHHVKITIDGFREFFFGRMMSVNTVKEKELLEQVRNICEQHSVESPIYQRLPDDAQHFLEKEFQRIPIKDRQGCRSSAEFFSQPKNFPDLRARLNMYVDKKKSLIDLAELVYLLLNKRPTYEQIRETLFKLPNRELVQQILSTLSSLALPAQPPSEALGMDLLTKSDQYATLLKTAIATAVNGLKMHRSPQEWFKEAWRCRFWFP